MNGPITNFELGKMQHREYEAQASNDRNQNSDRDNTPPVSSKHKFALALSGVGVTTILIVQMLVI